MNNGSMTSLAGETFIEVMKQVDRIAETNSPVLVIGDSSSCRELVASMIHHRSSRRDQPFITVDCAAIPPESMDAELFGLWEQADGGTIFLDDITETTTSFQTRLLRAVHSGERDVRAIAASPRNVEEQVAAGRFSFDLLSYLAQATIVLPALREPRPASNDWVTLSEIEGRYVARVLEHTGGNKQAAARLLSVDRKTLDRMIKRHHIDSNHVKALRVKASSRN
jgi:DNA-binding NtrC family response regulator